MSDTQNPVSNSTTLTIEQMRKLIPVVGYTASGFLPKSATYHLTTKDLGDEILKIATSYVKDFEKITFFNERNGNVVTWAWLPKNSPDLVDNTTQDSILGKAIYRTSPRLKEFINKFGLVRKGKNEDSAIVSAENSPNVCGIMLDLTRLLKMILDESGADYAANVGTAGTRRIRSNCEFRWHFNAEGNNKFANIAFLEVIKTAGRVKTDTDYRPRRSPKF